MDPFGFPTLMPGFVLSSTFLGLVVADIPLPQEMTALGMVGLFLLWLLKRENRAHENRDNRISALEADVAEQHHLKHEIRTWAAGALVALDLALRQGQKCKCEAMVPVVDTLPAVIDRLTAVLATENP